MPFFPWSQTARVSTQSPGPNTITPTIHPRVLLFRLPYKSYRERKIPFFSNYDFSPPPLLLYSRHVWTEYTVKSDYRGYYILENISRDTARDNSSVWFSVALLFVVRVKRWTKCGPFPDSSPDVERSSLVNVWPSPAESQDFFLFFPTLFQQRLLKSFFCRTHMGIIFGFILNDFHAKSLPYGVWEGIINGNDPRKVFIFP